MSTQSLSLPVWASLTKDGLIVRIAAQPGAKVSGIVGLHGDRLKIKVSAPPVDGAANNAIEELFAELLDLPKCDVSIRSGLASRRKNVLIQLGTDQEIVVTKLVVAASRGPGGP